MTELKSKKIQVLRGIAIISVVFLHNTPLGFLQIWIRPLLNFGVGTFLFLSGMLSYVDSKRKKRIMKVLLPYIIWTLIYVLIGNKNNSTSISIEYIKKLVAGNSAPIMYYVFVYCELTLLIPLIDKLARSKYKYIGFLISPIEIIFMWSLPVLMGIDVYKYIQILRANSCIGVFIYFYLGYLLGNGLISLKAHVLDNRYVLVGIGGGYLLQVLEAYWFSSLGASDCGTSRKLSVLFCNILLMLLAYKWIMNKNKAEGLWFNAFKIVGDYSFGIFFSHIAIMKLLAHIPEYSNYIVYPFNAIVALSFSLLCIMIGRKIFGKYGQILAFK